MITDAEIFLARNEHAADSCREGSRKVREYLAEKPGASIACANIYYTEEI